MKELLLTFILAQAADTSTSCYAFSKGYMEANPVLPTNCAKLTTIKSSLIVGSLFVPKKAKRIVYITGVIAGTYATIHNIRRLSNGHEKSR